jgi:hypothetical protein
MKNFILAILIMVCAGFVAQAQSAVLTGTLSGHRTLYVDTCYNLQDCLVVPTGIILTIQPGTQILCSEDANLIIERGGILNAVGTSVNPIVFTSDQAVTQRTPGHWGGIAWLGSAPNNQALGVIDVVRCGNTYTAGGNNPTQNSSTMAYVRIEFAGRDAIGARPSALLLASLGSGTSINFVQASESATDGFAFMGGLVDAKNLLSLNSYRTDFYFTKGNVSRVQFGVALRNDVLAEFPSTPFSNGILIENDDASHDNTPNTYPVLSNFTLLDPSYCAQTPGLDIRHGVWMRNYARADLRHIVTSVWQNYGFYIEDDGSIGHTDADELNFAYSAIITNTPNYAHGGSTWNTVTGACADNMQDWIEALSTIGCEEQGNDLGLSSFDYNNSICSDYCNARPTLTYTGSNLNGTNFSAAPFNTFFTPTLFKGGIDTADWTLSWANYCPDGQVYCSLSGEKASGSGPTLQFAPNPATGSTTLMFDAPAIGQAQIIVMDKISGRSLMAVNTTITEPGAQRIALSLAGLRDNVYTVQLTLNGQVWYGKLSVQ